MNDKTMGKVISFHKAVSNNHQCVDAKPSLVDVAGQELREDLKDADRSIGWREAMADAAFELEKCVRDIENNLPNGHPVLGRVSDLGRISAYLVYCSNY